MKSSSCLWILAFTFFLVSLFSTAQAQEASEEPVLQTSEDLGREELKTGFFLERLEYKECVYSRSKKTELGDAAEIESSLRYQPNQNSFGRFRFETDPVENRVNNKTSQFEILGAHRENGFIVQVDTELNANDEGGTSLGFDLDSEGTFLGYEEDLGFGFKFFPFNFGSEVGSEFDTDEVARLFYVSGSPSTVSNTPLGAEAIAQKTIPGIEISYQLNSQWKGYLGAGFATYLFPANEDFDIRTNRNADRWERREDPGYKAGVDFLGSDRESGLRLEVVGHNRSIETGSLLALAGSLRGYVYLGRLYLSGEATGARTGQNPYRLSRMEKWFEQQTPFDPIYTDYYSQPQDWIDKSDGALALKIGYKTSDSLMPYLAYRFQGKYFVFRERESAHLLRTADETQSHGGLNRLGFGAFKTVGNVTINPELEYLRAENPVFGNSSDVRADRVLSSFKKEDYVLSLKVSYDFDGPRIK